jgi:hypothetical protein
MNGGLPAAHSKRSVVSAAQAKKSPSWTRADGARYRAPHCIYILLDADRVAMPSDKAAIPAGGIN